jgi:hypothetical protein
MTTIRENTKVTVGVLIALLAFAAWLTKQDFQNTANAAAIDELRTAQAQKENRDEQIMTDIAVIKSQVFEINKKLDR